MSLNQSDSIEYLRLHTEASQAAENLANRLKEQDLRAVFAESCTGGMAAALMVQIPGISNHFCGSAVTYRQATKQAWLQVSAKTLSKFTAESLETTEEMAIRVLKMTPEAHISAAITGHLCANGVNGTEGQFFVAVAKRSLESGNEAAHSAAKEAHSLTTRSRVLQQLEAAKTMLELTCRQLATSGS